MEKHQNKRNTNRELNLQEYREAAVVLKSRPRFIVVELTQACNLKCPMCREEKAPYSRRTMSDTMFQSISETLFPFAELVDLRGWGESLILPDITEKIERTSSFGCEIRFVTNLAFQKANVLDVLAAHACHIAVSVDCATPELYRTLRGGAELETVKRNIQYLTQLYVRLYGSTERLHFTTTVQRPALKELPQVVEMAASLGIREVRFFGVTASSTSPLALHRCDSEIDSALRQAADVANASGITLIAGTRLGSMAKNPSGVPTCMHPWAYTYVAYDGRIGFCDHLIGVDGEPYLLGDLNTAPFSETWNGVSWVALREEHVTLRRGAAPHFKECTWCYSNRYIDFETAFDPEAASRVVYLSDRVRLT